VKGKKTNEPKHEKFCLSKNKKKNINIWMEESSKEVKHCLHKLYTHKRISISSRERKKKHMG
jgi:hypothetical protein